MRRDRHQEGQGQGVLKAGLAARIPARRDRSWCSPSAVEWPETLHEFTPQTNVYGSLFFTITGFHAMPRARRARGSARGPRCGRGRERSTPTAHVTVQNFAMYWHFVDIVWIFVFLTIYLSPHF